MKGLTRVQCWLLVATVLGVLLLQGAAMVTQSLTAAVLWRRRREVVSLDDWRRRSAVVAGVVLAIYLGSAIACAVNIGIRHLLPVLPLVYLPAAWWGACRSWRAVMLATAVIVEAAMVSPLWMSATNTWQLGAHNPTRFSLSGADLEYRQSFPTLSRWLARRGVGSIRVLYPGLDGRAVTAYLPSAEMVRPGDPVEPGWYAVNVIIEQLVPAILRADPSAVHDYRIQVRRTRAWRSIWEKVRRGADYGYAAGTFHIYRLDGDERSPPRGPRTEPTPQTAPIAFR